MKQNYKFLNGYTMEVVDEAYAKNATLPQYMSKMVTARSSFNNTVMVKIFHHVNDGTECQCYMCKPRELSRVANTIQHDWNPVWFGAVPYVNAMYSLSNVNDDYGMEDGRMVVNYFFSNATTWRGIVAKTVKQELKYYLSQK